MLTRLFKGDRDKILAERRNKGVKLGNGGKVGSYTSGNNKSLKTLQNQNKKFKRQILALNRTGGGKDDDSGDEDNENYPSDAGDAFGGRNRKKANKKIWLIGCWCILSISLCIKLKYLVIKSLKHIINLTTTTQTRICAFTSRAQNISSSTVTSSSSKFHYGHCELDSHADTIVAGKNCIVFSYTGKECSVVLYQEGCDLTDNVPIANVATAWQSPENGEIFTLIFHEALWMGSLMDNSLINLNQLRHYGVNFQDDPTSNRPLSFISWNGDFTMPLHQEGTILYFDTHTPIQKELDTCPHINLSSRHTWNPS